MENVETLTGKEWLEKYDPEYKSPQKKAAETREIPHDLETLGELLSGHTHARKGPSGTWSQQPFVGFVGDAEQGTLQADAVDTSTGANPDHVAALRDMECKRNKRGKRGGKKKRK